MALTGTYKKTYTYSNFDFLDECCVFSINDCFLSSSPAGICAICERRYYSRGIQNTLHKRTERNYYKRTFGMESNWTKYRKSLAFTDQVIRSATSFMPWSLKIPISDSHHGFL